MGMHIQFNTAELTAEDLNVLRAIVGDSAPAAAPAAPAKAAAAAPAKKAAAAPAKKAAAAPAPEPEAEEPDPLADDGDEDIVGGDTVYTMKDAVARATSLVSAGHTARVKESLAGQGVKRVSELKDDAAIAAFMDALSDLD